MQLWESVTPETVVNCFEKAGISPGAQIHSQPDEGNPFKHLAAEVKNFQSDCDDDESSIHFTVSSYVDE